MNQAIPPECVALNIVRRTCRLTLEQAGEKVGLNRRQMVAYETERVAPPDLLEELLEAMGNQRALYEVVLSTLYRDRRAPAPVAPVDPTLAEWREMHARALLIGRQAELRAVERQAEILRARKTVGARLQAEALCARLEDSPAPWAVVEQVHEVQTWAVAERLAHRSAEVAPECVDRAMELAALAYRVAERAPCDEIFRQSLFGYTLTYGENALRAAFDLAGAKALFFAAEACWEAGAAARGPLEEWRLQGLAGSLHRDQQRLAESLAQIDASLAKAPGKDKGRILVSKALTLDRMGETDRALGLLAEAAQLAERHRNPRLRFIALFNRAAFLCRTGRHGESELLLRDLTPLAEPLGRGLNQSRLRWLRGSLAAGLGRWEEAESELQAARRELSNRNKVLESALVSLELLVLLARRERFREIHKLTCWLAPLIRHEKLSRDARAALRLVCDAAEGSGVTVELAERALHLFARAPKADLAGETQTPGRQEERPGPAGSPEIRPSFALAGGGCDGAVAVAAGIEDTAAVSGPGAGRRVQESAGRGPEAGYPGDHLVHEAGGLLGSCPAGRLGGSGRGEQQDEAQADGERTSSDYLSKHERAPSGSDSRGVLSWPHRSPHPENTGAENRLAPSPEIPPEDFPVFVRVLLALQNLTQDKLAAAAEISSTTLSNYMRGKTIPHRIRPVVERLARAAKVHPYVVDLYLLPCIEAERELGSGSEDEVIDAIFQRLRTDLQGLVYLIPPLGREKDEAPEVPWPPADVARTEALDLWRRLEGCSDAERRALVEWRDLWHPGLAELLCHLSEEAASDRADRALELAKLAHRIAEMVPGDGPEKRSLLGYALIFLANALRVAGDLPSARATSDEGLARWEEGAESPGFLAEWRVLDREASLLRDERQFDIALRRLAKALDLAPPEFTGRILLSKSAVYEQFGDGEQALKELRKAEPLIDREREPRHFLILRFNTASALRLLDRFEEAEAMYPEVQDLASGAQLDSVRLRWLAGRIDAGRGRLAESDAALEEVRQEFTRRSSAWDCSLVTLELATVRLRQGKTAEVRSLAEELVWVFEAQGIHREALAALALFRDTAKSDRATVDLTERLVRYLRKAQGDRGLRFGG